MAFFDDLGKTLCRAGEKAKQKALEIKDVGSIKMQISEENRKIERTYQKIGEMYYQAHKEKKEVSMGELLDRIEESKKKIASLEAELKEMNEKPDIVEPEEAAAAEPVEAEVVEEEPAEETAE